MTTENNILRKFREKFVRKDTEIGSYVPIQSPEGIYDWLFSTLTQYKKEIVEDKYKLWAKTHTPTWETDNLIGDILEWPDEYKGLYTPPSPKELDSKHCPYAMHHKDLGNSECIYCGYKKASPKDTEEKCRNCNSLGYVLKAGFDKKGKYIGTLEIPCSNCQKGKK